MDKIMQYIIDTNKNNNHGDWKPQTNHQENYKILEKKTCPRCGSILIRRPNKFKEGKFWWGCRAYPVCKYTEQE